MFHRSYFAALATLLNQSTAIYTNYDYCCAFVTSQRSLRHAAERGNVGGWPVPRHLRYMETDLKLVQLC